MESLYCAIPLPSVLYTSRRSHCRDYSRCCKLAMMGSFLSRSLLLVFGYAYPAYECFKTVEMGKPDIEPLIFWCQYWIIVALLTVSERLGDTCISWLPLYNEAKLAFFVYLWYPRTKGTIRVYNSFLRPYMMKHEMEIDYSLSELRIKAADVATFAWDKAVIYGEKGFSDILQNLHYASSTLISRPRIN